MPDQPDFDDDNECWNCGGEGVIYMCEDEIGCVDPESGCDLCERRCDVCTPRKGQASSELQQVLKEALEK